MKLNEKRLIKVLKPYFLKARAGDWQHALRVVKWVKELGVVGENNLDLLVTAAYVHDIGWSGVAPKGKIDLDEVLKLESKANKNSARLIKEVLTILKFTDSEIKTINRLVAAADKHESIKADEEIIVDADSLSKLCVEHFKEKYQPDSYVRLMELLAKEFSGRIKTPKGKKLFPKLLKELKKEVLEITNSS